MCSSDLIDSVSRMVGEVLKNDASSKEESFADGLLEYPHYTRPVVIDGLPVPDVLMSGHHAEIAKWRYEQSLQITKERRPELFKKYVEKSHDKKTMKILKNHL